MEVQLVTQYCVSRLQRYGATVRGNVTSVYPLLNVLALYSWKDVSAKRYVASTHTICCICTEIGVCGHCKQ